MFRFQKLRPLMLGSFAVGCLANAFAACSSADRLQDEPDAGDAMSDAGGGATGGAGAPGAAGNDSNPGVDSGAGGDSSGADAGTSPSGGTGGDLVDAGQGGTAVPPDAGIVEPMVGCGEAGQPCCLNGGCTQADTFCSGGMVCTLCGQPGGACCPDDSCGSGACCVGDLCVAEGSSCGVGAGECTASACQACGGAGQPCCDGSCSPTTECTMAGAQAICTVCGGDLESCCPMNGGFSARCEPGSACVARLAASVCRADCGSLDEPCCDDVVGGTGCSDNGLACNAGNVCVVAQ